MIGKKILAALLVVGGLLLTFVAQAEIKTYSGVGEDYANQFETQEDAKARAKRIAIEDAKKHAGVGLKTYSRSINSELVDDEVSTITSNSYKIVGDVKYEKILKPLTDRITVIVWRATVDVYVDDAEVKNWFKRTADEKKVLINRNRAAEEAFNTDIQTAEDLNKRAAGTLTEIEEFDLRHEVEASNNDFQVNQKIEDGNRLNYEDKPDEAIEQYGEALKIKTFYVKEKGQYMMYDFENVRVAKLRATERAKRNAIKKATVWVKDYSQRIGVNLTDDEYSFIANSTFRFVDEPEYQITPSENGLQIIECVVSVQIQSDDVDKLVAELKANTQNYRR